MVYPETGSVQVSCGNTSQEDTKAVARRGLADSRRLEQGWTTVKAKREPTSYASLQLDQPIPGRQEISSSCFLGPSQPVGSCALDGASSGCVRNEKEGLEVSTNVNNKEVGQRAPSVPAQGLCAQANSSLGRSRTPSKPSAYPQN